jgi:hypothetical protein
MYFKAFFVTVTGGAPGFDSETPRPVIAMRLVEQEGDEEAETEVLIANDDGLLAWVERSHLRVVEASGPGPRTAPREAQRRAPRKAPPRAPAKAPRKAARKVPPKTARATPPKAPRKTSRTARHSGGLVDQ